MWCSIVRSKRRIFLLPFLLLICFADIARAQSFQVRLAWDAPTTNADNTPLTDLAGFEMYTGSQSGNYGSPADVGNVLTTLISLSQAGTFYFAAKAYDTASPRNTSIFSNEISVTALLPALETGGVSGKIFTVRALTPGTATVLFSGNVTATATGIVFFGPIPALPAVIDLSVKAPGYLNRLVRNWQVSSSTALPALTAGDLNNDNIVNGFDFSVINQDWFQRGLASDLNGDGITNSFDFSFVNANWFKRGD